MTTVKAFMPIATLNVTTRETGRVITWLLLLPLALQPAVGFGLSNNTSPFLSYPSSTLSIFSLPALEDLLLLST